MGFNNKIGTQMKQKNSVKQKKITAKKQIAANKGSIPNMNALNIQNSVLHSSMLEHEAPESIRSGGQGRIQLNHYGQSPVPGDIKYNVPKAQTNQNKNHQQSMQKFLQQQIVRNNSHKKQNPKSFVGSTKNGSDNRISH